jgi:hypothetical protein
MKSENEEHEGIAQDAERRVQKMKSESEECN